MPTRMTVASPSLALPGAVLRYLATRSDLVGADTLMDWHLAVAALASTRCSEALSAMGIDVEALGAALAADGPATALLPGLSVLSSETNVVLSSHSSSADRALGRAEVLANCPTQHQLDELDLLLGAAFHEHSVTSRCLARQGFQMPGVFDRLRESTGRYIGVRPANQVVIVFHEPFLLEGADHHQIIAKVRSIKIDPSEWTLVRDGDLRFLIFIRSDLDRDQYERLIRQAVG